MSLAVFNTALLPLNTLINARDIPINARGCGLKNRVHLGIFSVMAFCMRAIVRNKGQTAQSKVAYSVGQVCPLGSLFGLSAVHKF